MERSRCAGTWWARNDRCDSSMRSWSRADPIMHCSTPTPARRPSASRRGTRPDRRPSPPEGGTERPTGSTATAGSCRGTSGGADSNCPSSRRGIDHHEDAWHALDCHVQCRSGTVSFHAGLNGIGGRDSTSSPPPPSRPKTPRPGGIDDPEYCTGGSCSQPISSWSNVRCPRRRNDGDRGLPLVRRLGSGHDDRPSRSRHRTDRRGVLDLETRRPRRDGLLPNLFPDDSGDPKYNTVDASLLFIQAVHAWFEATGDERGLARLWPTVRSIIHHYTIGTSHGIGVDASDGLLHAGTPGLQLTWMDARVGTRVITPRIGGRRDQRPVALGRDRRRRTSTGGIRHRVRIGRRRGRGFEQPGTRRRAVST